jgi:hypothetical protein
VQEQVDDLLKEKIMKKIVGENVFLDSFPCFLLSIFLQLQSKSKKNQQQQICKRIVAKWRSNGRGKEIFDLLQEV